MRIDLVESLSDALAISPGDLVSIVGAGGKTSLMYRLGRELSAKGCPTLLTTTTRLMYPGREDVPQVVIADETEATVSEVCSRMREPGLLLAARTRAEGKVIGYSTAFVERLRAQDRAWTILAECDGAKGKSLKVPRDGEPPVANSTSLYVVVIGADCFGRPVSSELVFEPASIAKLASVTLDSEVNKQVVVKAVLSPASYMGRKPEGARSCVFINKVGVSNQGGTSPGGRSHAGAFEVGLALKSDPAVERIVFGALRAGGSKAFLVLR